MSFTVIIPARLASTRLPNKPLADLGGKPMVVRVAERARASGAARIIVATDHADILAACAAHGIEACMTRSRPPVRHRPHRRSGARTRAGRMTVVVNLQGDEPLIDPGLLAACAARIGADVPMATCAHPLPTWRTCSTRTWSRWCSTRRAGRCISRAPPSPGTATPLPQTRDALPPGYVPLRHIGLYAYRNAFLQPIRGWSRPRWKQVEALEQLRVLWHGYPIAVHITDSAPRPASIRPKTWPGSRLHYAS
jgi:3-deoxy-manno-octulosonate cytidylyltransferase (CMP-KDO synthetase)